MRVLLLALLRSAPLVGVALAAPAVAAQAPIPISLPDTLIYADPGAVAGTPISIPVRIGADVTGRGIRSADVKVRFDPAVISLTSATRGSLVPSSCLFEDNDTSDQINIGIVCTLTGGPGTLAVLQGTLVAAGSTALTFVDETPFNEGSPAATISNGRLRIVTDPDPNIGAVEDRTMEEDGTAVVQFTLSDQDTPPEAITVTAASSSPALVPPDGLAVGLCPGQDATSACRTLTISPAPDANGSTTITLTANDNDPRSQNTSTSFELTVTPVNDAPTVASAVGDREAPAGSDPIEIDLAGVFADVDDATLQYAASSSAPETATASVSGTVASVVPVTLGTATITLQATDAAGLTATETFVLTVLPGVSTEPGAPAAFAVHGSAPNPATSSAEVVLDLPAASEVRVQVYDTAGRRVVDTSAGVLSAGARRRVPLALGTLPAGVYVYRVTAQSGNAAESASGRLVVVR